MVQKVVQGQYVGLGHLQRLVLGQLPVLAELRKERPEPVERLVEVLHSSALPGVGGQSSFPQDDRSYATPGPGQALRTGASVVLVATVVAAARGRAVAPRTGPLGVVEHVHVTELRIHGTHSDRAIAKECEGRLPVGPFKGPSPLPTCLDAPLARAGGPMGPGPRSSRKYNKNKTCYPFFRAHALRRYHCVQNIVHATSR